MIVCICVAAVATPAITTAIVARNLLVDVDKEPHHVEIFFQRLFQRPERAGLWRVPH
jgi:hypothetical protein